VVLVYSDPTVQVILIKKCIPLLAFNHPLGVNIPGIPCLHLTLVLVCHVWCVNTAEFLWSLGIEKSTPLSLNLPFHTPLAANLPTSCPTQQQQHVRPRDHTSLPLCALPILALEQTNAQLRSHRLCTNTRTAIGTDDHSLPGLSTCRNPSSHLLIQVGGNSSFSIYLLYTHAGYELISFLSDYIVIASPDGWRQTQYVYHFSAISAQSCPSAMRSLLMYTIAFFLPVCVRGIVRGSELEKRDNITLQAPVVAVPSQYWYVVHQNNIPKR
jgi:hypothetical protein